VTITEENGIDSAGIEQKLRVLLGLKENEEARWKPIPMAVGDCGEGQLGGPTPQLSQPAQPVEPLSAGTLD
jgi:hypothetical protein